MDIVSQLEKYNEYLQIDSFFTKILRSFGWMLIKLLSSLLDAVQSLVNEVLKLNIFFKNEQLNNFINGYKPFFYVLLALSFIFIGYKTMTNKKENFSNIAVNFLIGVVTMTMLPTAINDLNNLVMAGIRTTGIISSNFTPKKIIKDNVVDILLLGKEDDISRNKNKIAEENILYLDPTEIVYGNLNDSPNKDLFRKKININETGGVIAIDLSEGDWGIGKERYFRYSINFLAIIPQLTILSATLMITAIKVVMIIFELGIMEVLAYFFSYADISGGQRLKMILKNIVNSLIVLFFISVVHEVYIIFNLWASSYNALTYLVLMFGGSAVVIMGPNIIKKILGVETSNASMFNKMLRRFNKTMKGKLV